MIRPSQIHEQIEQIAAGHISIDEFEQWFRHASRNFHAYPDKQAKAMVFEIESVLSEYRDGLSEQKTQKELAAAIRPFEERKNSYARFFRAVKLAKRFEQKEIGVQGESSLPLGSYRIRYYALHPERNGEIFSFGDAAKNDFPAPRFEDVPIPMHAGA